jgi:hypothetical protein
VAELDATPSLAQLFYGFLETSSRKLSLERGEIPVEIKIDCRRAANSQGSATLALVNYLACYAR